jgi:uncharacterized membrane protein
MANLTNNRLNITATPTQIAAVKTALQTINANLPFLVGLTTEERQSLASMDVNNKTFTEDALNGAVNNPTLVPAYISVPNMQNDLTLFSQLDELLLLAQQICERIEDTKILAGSESYEAARLFYQSVKTAAEAGIAGADTIASQLGSRFSSQGKSQNTPTV